MSLFRKRFVDRVTLSGQMLRVETDDLKGTLMSVYTYSGDDTQEWLDVLISQGKSRNRRTLRAMKRNNVQRVSS